MDSSRFLVACVSHNSPHGFGWLVDDDSELYFGVDAMDLPDVLLERVFALYQKSYSGLSEKPLLARSEQLLKYNRWVLICANASTGGLPTSPNDVIGFAMFSVKPGGLKAGLFSTDGSRSAAKAVIRFTVGAFSVQGVYGEVSPPLESRLQGQVPVVPIEQALKLLSDLGKDDVSPTTDDHYHRFIGRLGLVEKVMVGKPNTP